MRTWFWPTRQIGEPYERIRTDGVQARSAVIGTPTNVFEDAGADVVRVARVCHAPGVVRQAKAPDGTPLVAYKAVTGFTNTEAAALDLTAIVPFLVEDEIKRSGGVYPRGADWQPDVVGDGLPITGLNRRAREAEDCLKPRTYAARPRRGRGHAGGRAVS